MTAPSSATDANASIIGAAPQGSSRKRGSGLVVLGTALVAIVFGLDLLLPLGYAGGMLYVVPVVLGLWASSPRYPLVLAGLTSVLTVVGFLLSSGETSTTVLLNRVGAIVAVGAITLAVTRGRRDQQRLLNAEEVLRGIHALASNPDLDFSSAAQSLLRLGCAQFGLTMGMLSKIDGDTLEVIEVVAPPGTLATGDVMPLRGIPCARTVSATVPVQIDSRAMIDGYVTERYHPALPLEVYIGAPVRVGERIYGTLAFWGERTRATHLFRTDHEIIRLMARWVGAEIERREARLALARSERQFQQAQKLEAVGRLAAGIAHDFNNLLMGMGGCVSLALRRVGPQSEAVPVLNQLREAVGRGSSITRQLLTFSRKQGGERVRVGLDEVVEASEKMLRPLLGADIELEVCPGAGDFEVSLGSGQLDQILMNLAVNARDAMSTGDRLRIESERVELAQDDPRRPPGLRAGEYAILTVSDTGAGMDGETRAKVFEPFFTTKEVGRGTGLGLSTVYAIVEQLGGRIELESELGRGTQFRIWLPRASEAEAGASAIPDRPRMGHETILIVEDEALVRQAIETELEPWGYELLVAASGPEALEICSQRRGSIDVLLTDMVLPLMRGSEIAQRARALIPGLHVIFMSAYPRDQLQREGRIDENAVTLQKPFHVDALMGRLRELLGPGQEEFPPIHEASAASATLAPRPSAAPRVPAPTSARPPAGESGEIGVLLVEDDALSRALGQELLEEMGYRVVTAENGQQAREHFSDPFDIIITDLNLPDAKGPDLIDDLRSRRPGLPAIVTSGADPEEPPIRRVLAQPRTAFVSKPVDIDDLDRVARALIALP